MVKANSKAEIGRITKGLQDAVREHFLSNDDPETLTINNIRSQAEEALKLKADFFKNDPFWKSQSKKVIREEVDKQNNQIEEEAKRQESSQPSNASHDKENKTGNETDTNGANENNEEVEEAPRKAEWGKKREKGAVKRKPVAAKDEEATKLENELIASDDDDGDMSPRKKRRRTKPGIEKGAADTKRRDTNVSGSDEVVEQREEAPAPPAAEGSVDDPSAPKPTCVVSESEMSEVVDLTPQKKKRGASKSRTNGSNKGLSKPSSKKQAKKDVAPLSADEEKIKSLQGWLLKCGIRKLWGKELKKFSAPKEKVQYLKGLLEDVGMTGRYSTEKAKRIKEERELAAEVEAVQAGASTWGVETSDKVQTRASRNAAPVSCTTRRLVRPELAFLEDQSESDD